jgi:Flp pilus assembly protein TadD
MAQQSSTQRTGALSQSLGEIANLLSSDPRVAASRARELLKRYPGQEQALLLLVSARRLAGDLSGGRNILQSLARVEPELAAVQYELGLLLSETGAVDLATAAFSRVVELEPAHGEAWRALGDALSEMGRTAAAGEAYAKHFEVCAAEFRRMESAAKGGDEGLAAAERMLRDYLKVHPGDVSALHLLADVHLRLGHDDDAEKILSLARAFCADL